MVVINLKTPITFRVEIVDTKAAFSTKTFRAEKAPAKIPESKDLVAFDVTEIVLDSTIPWYKLPKAIRTAVLWSNVLSVQHEDVV